MTYTATIKIAPIVSVEHEPRPGRTLFYRHALQLLPGRDSVPLVVDHNMGREVGRVDKLFTLDWLDGPWICASATLDNPPSWLRRGTSASFARWDAHVSDEGRVLQAWLKEVTVCLATEPSEAGAQVLSLRPAETKRKVREEIIEPTVIRRAAPIHREDEEIAELRRRMTWNEEHRTGASLETILEGMRSELRRRPSPLRVVA